MNSLNPRGAGRKHSPDPKNKTLNLRVKAETLAEWDSKAAQLGLSRTAFIELACSKM
jgi:hypothetical protein